MSCFCRLANKRGISRAEDGGGRAGGQAGRHSSKFRCCCHRCRTDDAAWCGAALRDATLFDGVILSSRSIMEVPAALKISVLLGNVSRDRRTEIAVGDEDTQRAMANSQASVSER